MTTAEYLAYYQAATARLKRENALWAAALARIKGIVTRQTGLCPTCYAFTILTSLGLQRVPGVGVIELWKCDTCQSAVGAEHVLWS